ncbi:3-hydroxyacyl-CoA dehydrogenase [Caballeronia arationis]|uniref:3-hydroxyacyl-CoA dehydrogenase n=1 Tax=Caballeronia arationis TaxID=1777142 RepID=A0A7Z7IFB9_9BURK|nr:3-hydroxyacyl-CoA dehydrogenase [Caballeronia arationis]SOE91439.1 3-hydroxyacyl-CoA dehydrogenase [Caballeronia arationis]
MRNVQDAKIGIVGAGAMGQGIAQVAAVAGLEVRLMDIDTAAAARAIAAVGVMLDKLAAKGKLTSDQAQAALGRIQPVDLIGGLSDCDLVVEAIVEKLEVKRALFGQLEEVVHDDAVLVSNTSSLSITAIAAGCRHPQRVAGFHFFNPVPLMKVVEVVRGLRTNDAIIDWLAALAAKVGHTAVRCRDIPGFIVNHAGRALNTEGLRIVQEGVADEGAVDAIVRDQMGFRMGPFELLDLTGLDVSHPVMESIYRQFYDEPRFRPSPITAIRLAGGMLGRKTGSGFYEYDGGIKVTAPAATQAMPGWKPASVWVSSRNPEEAQRVLDLLQALHVEVEMGVAPSDDALIIVTPLGQDATTCAIAESLDATRVVAVDTLFGFDASLPRVIMPTPATRDDMLTLAQALFGIDGVSVFTIRDSGGFIAQRVIACIVNTACEIAQQRIATPDDIDAAVRLSLGYPFGPLALGDRVGAKRIVTVLKGLVEVYGDPRYRPGVWLARRAALGLPLRAAD